MEEWKKIKDFPCYEVSNLGNFKRIAEGKGTFIGKPRKTYKNPVTGYLNVTLSGTERAKTNAAHRLVAETWIPNPLNLPQVNHIDKDRTNNKVSNLEWVTQEENSNGQKVTGKNLVTGEKKEFLSIAQASRYTNVNHYKIGKILRGGLDQLDNWTFYQTLR